MYSCQQFEIARGIESPRVVKGLHSTLVLGRTVTSNLISKRVRRVVSSQLVVETTSKETASRAPVEFECRRDGAGQEGFKTPCCRNRRLRRQSNHVTCRDFKTREHRTPSTTPYILFSQLEKLLPACRVFHLSIHLTPSSHHVLI